MEQDENNPRTIDGTRPDPRGPRPLEYRPAYTVADAARDALQVQDACNLSGVARGFVRAIDALRAGGVTDTDAVRRHPVAVLFTHKLASLAGVEPMGDGDVERYFRATRGCEELAGAEVKP